MKDFFAMGGYAFYVWMSYGIAAVALVVNVVLARLHHRDQIARITRRKRRKKAQK